MSESIQINETLEELPVTEESSEKQPSIRESLAAALEQSKQDKTEESTDHKTEKAGRQKDDENKLTREQKKDKTNLKIVPKETIKEPEVIAAPTNLAPAIAAEWKNLSPTLQKEIAKREEEYHKELTKHDEERVFGRSVKSLSDPYLPLIKAEGGDVVKAFGSYLNTAYILRTKSPQEKGKLLLQLAQEYGADLRGALQPQTNVDPRFNQVQQELHQVRTTLQQQQEEQKQREETALQSQIEAFAADSSNPHFELVKPDMAALLKGGVAKDLQDAYDRAVYANPQTRSTLLQQQSAESEEKRLADKKAKAEQARRAGSSLHGSPGITATKNGRIPQKDLRSEIAAAFASHRDG